MNQITQNTMSDWDALLDEFRALGGTVSNISLRNGPHGRGLFLTDPAEPPQLHVPESLLLHVEDILFEDGKLKISPTSKHTDRARDFLESYENLFSWGVSGHTDVEQNFELMQQFPEKVRELLVADFGFHRERFLPPSDEKLQKRYIDSRSITHHDKVVLMPILGLANHGDNGQYKSGDGLTLQGKFTDEILVRYAFVDSLEIFKSWGFAAEVAFAYSLPLQLPLKIRQLVITRRFSKIKRVGQMNIPDWTADADRIVLFCSMLGNRRFPRLPKGTFLHTMQAIGVPNPDQVFDEIQRYNSLKFLELLGLLEDDPSPAAALLRKVVRYQLIGMSHHRGARKLTA
jgi:hypothetical protein